MLKVSLITTVKNEADSIERLLESLLAQSRKPEEVIIVDGGSTDGTVEVVRAYQGKLPLKLIIGEGFNISQGRNAAIAQAQGEVIASTDAGVRLDRDWLKYLLAPFEEDDSIDVVSGFFLPDPQSAFEVALGATVLPTLSEIDPHRFLPSSRSVVFRREAWKEVGGYPEWLDYCEDLVFDFRLRHAGFKFLFAPQAVVYFRPRPHLVAFFRQYYRYARGDGKADLWRGRHAIRYLSYLVAGPLLVALGFLRYPLWCGGLFLGAAICLWTPYKRLLPLLRMLSPLDKVKALLLVPLIRVTGDIAKMAGYPVGVLWRWKSR
ncbi:MAG TPA: glycosyl transferase [Chloroflexi bacterium]|nr:glycosyl transferase [Chloroflexota bacterium]